MNARSPYVALAFALSVVASCQCDRSAVLDNDFACTKADDCAEGFVCHPGRKVCVSTDAGLLDGGGGNGGAAGDGGEDGGDDGGPGGAGGAGGAGGEGDAGDSGSDAGDGGRNDAGLEGVHLAWLTRGVTLAPGACSQALTLQVRDFFGDPVVPPEGLEARLETYAWTTGQVIDAGFKFFSDPGCTVGASALRFDGGSASASVYLTGDGVAAGWVIPQAGSLTGPAHSVAVTQPPDAGPSHWEVSVVPSARAGECFPIVVRRVGANGVPLSLPLTEHVLATTRPSANPDGGVVTLYSDAACTNAVTSSFGVNASVAANTTQSTYYAKIATGRAYTFMAVQPVPTSELYRVTAVHDLEVLPAVRQGTCALASSATSADCPVFPRHVDLTATALVTQVLADTPVPAQGFVRCTLPSVNRLRCTRRSAGVPAQVSFQTLELATGFKVQRVGITCGSATSGAVNLPSATLPGSTFILSQTESNATSLGASAFVAHELLSSSSVGFSVQGSVCESEQELQVAEFAGAVVARQTFALDAGRLSTTDMMLPLANLSSSALFFSYAGTPSPDGGQPACDRTLRGRLVPAALSTFQVSFARGLTATAPACTGFGVDKIAAERVDFGTRASVVELPSVLLSTSETTKSILIPQVKDRTRTWVLAAGQGGLGQSLGETDVDHWPSLSEGAGAFSLRAADGGLVADQLVTDRAGNRGTARFSVYAIEFNP